MNELNNLNTNDINPGIVGLGTYFPEKEVDDSLWDNYNFTNVVTGRTPFDGVETRLEFPEDLLPSDAGVIAGQAALNDADIDPSSIDLVLSSSLPGDFIIPGDVGLLIKKLGLKNATGMNIETGCASSVSCLMVASSMIQSGMYKNILIVNSCFYSRLKDYSCSFSVALGDSVGAMVVSAVPADRGYLSSYAITDGENHSAFTVDVRYPKQEYRKNTTEPGLFVSYDYDQAKAATLNSKEYIVTVFNKLLEQTGLEKDEVDIMIPHQGVHWLPTVWSECLDFDLNKVCHTFQQYGSNASASVPVNLEEARKRGMLKDGANIFVFQIGSGFHYKGFMMRWYDKKQYKA
ncbi:3-oxoacyl-ACP synthase III family protein [Alteromonas sp. a30]|uniref:3-oxoacyl-ACP synthase III family protein n=1 Tax=Alteromonas sp. a30 TaxID=2730917 RepID=UPI0022816F20|nr:3-oxoacyl-ACP synthase III family protein [Alteromonas sp. a30]MCY7297271.1 3-oxoacyl-ACP synthase III family protein [Alteromonas sp. a30]